MWAWCLCGRVCGVLCPVWPRTLVVSRCRVVVSVRAHGAHTLLQVLSRHRDATRPYEPCGGVGVYFRRDQLAAEYKNSRLTLLTRTQSHSSSPSTRIQLKNIQNNHPILIQSNPRQHRTLPLITWTPLTKPSAHRTRPRQKRVALSHSTITPTYKVAMSTTSRSPLYNSSSVSPLKRKAMSVTQTYYLAHTARGKLSHEAAKADHNLRLLVGHANLLDSLMLELAEAEQEQESWFNQSVKKASKTEEPKHIQWADAIVEDVIEAPRSPPHHLHIPPHPYSTA
jgi:hypothetical protein